MITPGSKLPSVSTLGDSDTLIAIVNPGSAPQTSQISLADLVALLTSDRYYLHTQSSASNSWSITHTLGRRPEVQIFNDAGDEISGVVSHPDDDHATVSLNAAVSGTAVCIA